MTEKTGKQQGRFKAGESGNPAGRPKGARNKATLAIETLLEGEAESLTRKCIEKALEGDVTALRLCLDRLAPPRRDMPTPFNLPQLKEAADARDAFAAVIVATAEGEMTLSEALPMAKPIGDFVSVDTATDDARRAHCRKKNGFFSDFEL